MHDVRLIRCCLRFVSYGLSGWRKPLNQQVPGSSPGRRTKVVKLYGLMHRNGRTNWAMDEGSKILKNIAQRETRPDSPAQQLWFAFR
jgi:hypothetical protein